MKFGPILHKSVASWVFASIACMLLWSHPGICAQKAPLSSEVQDFLKQQAQASTLFQKTPNQSQTAQLEWLQPNRITTSESNVRIGPPTTSLNIEVKRAYGRWYNTLLLRDGSERAYQAFVEAQPTDDKLNLATFRQLSGYIQALSEPAFEALLASCFIAMSEQAKTLAKEKNVDFSPDSEQFLTQTLNQCAEIYPSYRALNTEGKSYLLAAFLKDSHLRHMLLTEGGDNMYTFLKSQIQNGQLPHEAYDMWFARWIANITGFRSHENLKGSIYLTQSVANDMLLQKAELDKLWQNPHYSVRKAYLRQKGEKLGIKSPYLTHLAIMMRLRNPADITQLKAWFNQLAISEQIVREAEYEQFCQHITVTPTYEPAVLDNLKALGCTVAQTASIHAALKSSAMAAYQSAQERGEISPRVPLCYRDVALQKNLIPLVECFKETNALEVTVKLDRQGNIEATPIRQKRLSLK